MFSYLFNKKKTVLDTDKLEYSKFNLENVIGNFLVDSVYDGDTVIIVVPTKLEIYNMLSAKTLDQNPLNNSNITLNKIKVRLDGIDTPELKPSKNLPNREEHIHKAKLAKNYLSDLILNKIIKVQFLSNDKYGRPLVKLFIIDDKQNVICINDLMIEKGFANKYDGGTKNTNFDNSNDYTNFVEINI